MDPEDDIIKVRGYQTAKSRGTVHLFSRCPNQHGLKLIDKGVIEVPLRKICRPCRQEKLRRDQQ